jgi:hypothetical protein
VENLGEGEEPGVGEEDGDGGGGQGLEEAVRVGVVAAGDEREGRVLQQGGVAIACVWEGRMNERTDGGTEGGDQSRIKERRGISSVGAGMYETP